MNWIKKLFSGAQKIEQSAEPKATSEQLRARFANLYRPAIQLRPTPTSPFSKLGGLPSMPAHFEWPQWKGKPQSFLAQVDLGEMSRAHPSFLPPEGYLHFFYDQDQSVWGFDPQDRGGWRVLYTAEDKFSFNQRPAPEGLPDRCVYRSKPIAFDLIQLLPDSQSLPGPRLKWKTDGETYDALRKEAFADEHPHQMLGYPSPVQGDDMELECQLASNGINVGNPAGYKDPRRASLETGAKEWKLLLQLDTDNDTGWMWGDVGTIYFWIREEDARKADFSKVWMIFQCC